MAAVGQHPHVLTVLGACLEPPSLCILMELSQRGSLWAALHESGMRPQYGAWPLQHHAKQIMR